MFQRPIIVAAVGCSMACDDAIGLHLASSLDDGTVLSEAGMDMPSGILEFRRWEDADSLTVAQELLECEKPVFLIDCANMGLEGGASRTFDPDSLRCHSSSVSCHGFGMAEALELAATLGFNLPVRIFGVQPFDCSPSLEMTPEMMACYDRVLLECCTALNAFLLELNLCASQSP